MRVGNGAWNQRQLDVYGELLDAVAAALRPSRPASTTTTRRFLVALADAAASRWREHDQGIWEVRGEPRHFLYSKLMCWVALDRADQPRRAAARRATGSTGWEATRDEIADADPRARAGATRAGAFTQSFGSDELDASNLMMPIVGFLPADDPRVLATIDAIDERLTDDRGLVYRYLAARRARGRGGHVPAVHVLAGPGAGHGRSDRPGPRGVRPGGRRSSTTSACWPRRSTRHSGELLGNFPQAFSHIGLVNAAWAISQAEDASA